MELTDRKITSLNVEETQRIAAALAKVVVPGAVIALEGDLGAGKTHFTQGLARGLGVGEAVTSPTFNVMSVYDQGRLPLYHFDLYRLEDALELEDIAFYDYVEADGVSCIEWAAKFPEEIPTQALWILDHHARGQRAFDRSAHDKRRDASTHRRLVRAHSSG